MVSPITEPLKTQNKNSSCYLTICCINFQLGYCCIINTVDHMSTDFLLSLKETHALSPRNTSDYLTVASSGVADLITGPLGPIPFRLCHIRNSEGVSLWFQLPLLSLSFCSAQYVLFKGTSCSSIPIYSFRVSHEMDTWPFSIII